MHLPAFDDEFDLHFFAQFLTHQRRMGAQGVKGIRCHILKRGAARVFFQIKRLGSCPKRLAPLTLAQVAPCDLALTIGSVDQLKHARAAFALTETGDHFLHHQPQPGIRRGAARLPQKPRRCTIPCPRHGAEHCRKLRP